MSARATRRRRRSRRHGTATLVISVAAAALAAYRAGLVLAIALAMAAGITVTLVIIARRHPHLLTPGQPAPAPARKQAASQVSGRARHAVAPAGKLRSLPRAPKLITMSQECAGGECHLCPAPDACEHCDHEPAGIVDRNRKAYDAAANGDSPPF